MANVALVQAINAVFVPFTRAFFLADLAADTAEQKAEFNTNPALQAGLDADAAAKRAVADAANADLEAARIVRNAGLEPFAYHNGRRQHQHPERFAGRRSVRLVQFMVHALRPVLRSRPRPRRQRRQRHGLHSVAARTIRSQPGPGRRRQHREHRGRRDELHGADARHGPGWPGRHLGQSVHGCRRIDGRHSARQHHDVVRRSEPDLHIAFLASSVPAPIRARCRRRSGLRPAS